MTANRHSHVGLFFDLQGGFAARETFKGDVPAFGYDYLNTYLGLRLGKASGFHWNVEVGPTYMHVNTSNFASITGANSSLTLGNPTVNGWIFPTFETGFGVVFP